MPSSNQRGVGTSGSPWAIWNRPAVKYLAAGVATVAAVAKIIEYLFQPTLPSAAKSALWVVLCLALLPFILQCAVSSANWLVKRAIEQQGYPENLLARSDGAVVGEVAYVFNSRLYGLAYEELIAHCTIHENGSAAFRREVELVAHSVVNKIELYMILPEAPRDGEDLLELVKVESLTRFRRIEPRVDKLSSGQMYLTMSFSPQLSSGQCIRYQVTEESRPGLYAVTGREERKMPYDYFAWDITNPTKKLEMKVFFPEGVRPQAFEPDVWHALGQGQSTHSQEYDRVKELLVERQEGVFHALMFTIPYPILGLSYVIRWTPPRAA